MKASDSLPEVGFRVQRAQFRGSVGVTLGLCIAFQFLQGVGTVCQVLCLAVVQQNGSCVQLQTEQDLGLSIILVNCENVYYINCFGIVFRNKSCIRLAI